ncbi:hypothetical protein ACWEQA_12305 [Nocardia sp. NPDC004085]
MSAWHAGPTRTLRYAGMKPGDKSVALVGRDRYRRLTPNNDGKAESGMPPPFKPDLNDPLTADINLKEPALLMVRMHLWIEHALIGLIENSVPSPEFLNLSRLSFPQKVDLAAAYGYIDHDLVPMLYKINSLRNKVAHRLDAGLGPSAAQDLFNTCPEIVRWQIKCILSEQTTDPDWLHKIRWILIVINQQIMVQMMVARLTKAGIW